MLSAKFSFVIAALLIAHVTALKTEFTKFTPLKLSSLFKDRLPDDQYTILIENNEQLDDYSKSVIHTISGKEFFLGLRERKNIASVLFNFGVFTKIQIITTGFFTYDIVLSLRSPSFCVFNGKLKYSDANGTIFGSSVKRENCKDGLLRGLLPQKPDGPFTSKPPHFQLSEENSLIIREALDLKAQLRDSKIMFNNEITFHETRGFVVFIESPPIQVIIGRPPYEQKISRLLILLARNDIVSLERIELDYSNKAFIKRRKSDVTQLN